MSQVIQSDTEEKSNDNLQRGWKVKSIPDTLALPVDFLDEPKKKSENEKLNTRNRKSKSREKRNKAGKKRKKMEKRDRYRDSKVPLFFLIY